MRRGASLQRKFSFSYIAIILAVLILMNTYPLIASENRFTSSTSIWSNWTSLSG